MSERCRKIVGPRWGRNCSKPVVRDGYCKIHHPDDEAARRKASDDRFAEQRAAEAAVYERKRVRDRKADLFDELVAALQTTLNLVKSCLDYPGSTDEEDAAVDAATAALAKAKEIGP